MNHREWALDVNHHTDLSGVKEVLVEIIRRVSEDGGNGGFLGSSSGVGIVRRDVHQVVFYAVCAYRSEVGGSMTAVRFTVNSGGVWSKEVDVALDRLIDEGMIRVEKVVRAEERTEEFFADESEIVVLDSEMDFAVKHAVEVYEDVSREELRTWVHSAVPDSASTDLVFTQEEVVDIPRLF